MAIFLEEYCHLTTQGPGQGEELPKPYPCYYLNKTFPLSGILNLTVWGLRFMVRIVQRRCRILEIVLTTCWVHTTLARYGCEYPCLLRKIYAWGLIYHFPNIMNN